MIKLISDLIEIPALSGQEQARAEFLKKYLEEIWPASVQLNDRNLLLELGGSEEGPTILLCSHIDTVAPCAGWSSDPYSALRDGEKITGLGANDALASVVGMVEALKELTICRGRVLLALVCEEESGGSGFAAVEPNLPRYDFGIFGEPTAMQIGYCMRGAMRIQLKSRGRSCHASRPHEGESAFWKFTEDLSCIRKMQITDDSPWGGATVEPTVVSGGKSPNQIPDLIETTLDVRTTPTFDNERILEILEVAGLDFEVTANRRRPVFIDPKSPLIKAATLALSGSGLVPFGGTCDMAFASAPSIVVGPGSSERSHAANEFITVSELESGKAGYRRLLQSLGVASVGR